MTKVDIEQFNEMLTQVNSFIMDVPNRIEEVKRELLSHRDKILDIEHFIELNKLNGADGWKIQNRLREVLNSRRKLKDELEYLESISTHTKQCLKKDNALTPIALAIRDKKQKLNNRAYTPRVLLDLFEKDGTTYKREDEVK